MLLDGRLVGHVQNSRASSFVSEVRQWKCKVLSGLTQRRSGQKEEDGLGSSQEETSSIDVLLEIAHIPFRKGEKYPGIYVFTSSARMMREVYLLDQRVSKKGSLERFVCGKELIGSLEQTFLDVHCPDKYVPMKDGAVDFNLLDPKYTHLETSPSAMLSIVASLTPWSDFNQSPRNMY